MLSPDPIVGEPEKGRNYNRYSYVFNNPLRYDDPSGFTKRSNSKIVCTDSCTNNSGAGAGLGMEHVTVVAQDLSGGRGIIGNSGALAHSGLSGGGSPEPASGDRVDLAGGSIQEAQPVEEDACLDQGNHCSMQQNGTETILTLRSGKKKQWVRFPWFKASNFDTGELFSSGPRSTGAAATQAIQGGALMLGAGAAGAGIVFSINTYGVITTIDTIISVLDVTTTVWNSPRPGLDDVYKQYNQDQMKNFEKRVPLKYRVGKSSIMLK